MTVPEIDQQAYGKKLSILGVSIVVATLIFHGWLEFARPDQKHEFLMIPLVVGAIVGWWGFYWMMPRRAKEGMGILLSATERIKRIRTGNREGDPEVVVKETTTSEVVVPSTPQHQTTEVVVPPVPPSSGEAGSP
jgi:hypothetical protein